MSVRRDHVKGQNAVIQMDSRTLWNGDVMKVEVALKFDPDDGSIEVIRSDFPELPPGRFVRDESR